MQWNELSVSNKAALMRIYIENGITDLDVMQAHYNQQGGKVGRNSNSANSYSSLPNNSRTYERWADAIARHKSINIANDKTYDYRRYYNENTEASWRMLQVNTKEHFPDTYKLPVHPTFSNESVYSRGPQMGGNWLNDSTFVPSVINRQYYPNVYREDRPYTEREIYQHEFQNGGIVTPLGQWQYPGKVTTIPSNNITMQGVNYPVIGISDKGDTKLMMPNRNYQFKGKSVTEYPLTTHRMQEGGTITRGSFSEQRIYNRFPGQYATGGHLFTDGGETDGSKEDKNKRKPDNPPTRTYDIPMVQPMVSTMDPMGGLGYQVVYFTEEQEKKRAAAEAEAQRREAERIARQPVLRADTRTQADRDRAARQAKQAEYNRLVNEQKDRLMSVGRPNTESQQAAILGMPYVAEAAKNYVQNFDPTAEIRNAMYFVPGVSNVMMAQDAKQAFDNNQTGAGVLNAAFALTPVFGLTPSFKSPLRYTKPANRIGDWTILDYGRNTTTTPVQSTTTPMLGTTNNLMLSSVERPTQGRIGTTSRQQLTYNPILQLVSETPSSNALYQEAMALDLADKAKAYEDMLNWPLEKVIDEFTDFDFYTGPVYDPSGYLIGSDEIPYRGIKQLGIPSELREKYGIDVIVDPLTLTHTINDENFLSLLDSKNGFLAPSLDIGEPVNFVRTPNRRMYFYPNILDEYPNIVFDKDAWTGRIRQDQTKMTEEQKKAFIKSKMNHQINYERFGRENLLEGTSEDIIKSLRRRRGDITQGQFGEVVIGTELPLNTPAYVDTHNQTIADFYDKLGIPTSFYKKDRPLGLIFETGGKLKR